MDSYQLSKWNASNPSDSLLGKRKKIHSPSYIVAILGTTLLFGLVLFMNYFNQVADGVLFTNTTGATANYYYLEITPAGWAFSIWALIYLQQVGFLIYSIVSIFRNTRRGPLYIAGPTIPLPVFFIYSINCLSNIGWLLAFDRHLLVLSFFLIITTPLTLIACLISAFSRNKNLVRFFQLSGQEFEMTLLNIFVYNAWAVYLGWTVCASLLSFGTVLVYSLGSSQETAGIISLTFLLLIILVFYPFELFVYDRYFRYIIMHYVGPAVALVGCIVKDGNNDIGHVPSGVNLKYAVVILGILAWCFLGKVICLLIKVWKRPLYLGHREYLPYSES